MSTADASRAALRADGETILRKAIRAVLPDGAVRRALAGVQFPGRVFLVAAGKAAWQMASVAREVLPTLAGGVVVTKYGHAKGPIDGVACYEGAHPVPDENGLRGTEAALALTEGLRADDTVLFLLSGGGSALFEQPLLPLAELQDITSQLLAAGADIVEINTIRKRLSGVKGGRFAAHCAPAQVCAIVLSDIVGDPLDMIASGPACPDRSTCAQALAIAEKYALRLSAQARALLDAETPKALSNVMTKITGSVRELCAAAHRPAHLRGARGGQLPCLRRPHARKRWKKPRLPRGRRDGRAPHGQRKRRAQPGARARGGARHRGTFERAHSLRRVRRHGRPHRRSRRHCGRRHGGSDAPARRRSRTGPAR